MSWVVVVPEESRGLFANHAAPGVEPVFYRVRRERLHQRLLRRLGREVPARAVGQRFEVVEGGDRLGRASALWLGQAAWLPAAQMEALLDRLPHLTWSYLQQTGTEDLDLMLFRRRGVMVSNSGRLSSRRVAEMALCAILAHAKRLPEHLALQRRRRWQSLRGQELRGRTVGVVGTGNIGGEVAALCRAIGMRVIGASRDPRRFGEESAPYDRVLHLRHDLTTLLAESDYVILTLPLNEETRGLIGSNELRSMRPTAGLVNVARGPLVDERSLRDALRRGWIAAAYVDRPAQVPLPRWSRLYGTRNLVLTHYSAASSEDAMVQAFDQFLRGCQAIMETGQAPDRVV